MSLANDKKTVQQNLVAYLDGELDVEATHQIEKQLKADKDLQQEVARLSEAWDCLDTLSSPVLDGSFTRSTVAMVALTAKRDLDEQQTSLKATCIGKMAGALSLLFGSFLLGFFLTATLWPDPDRQLGRYLPVLENLDPYLMVNELTFLTHLRDAGLFVAEANHDTPADTGQGHQAFEPDTGQQLLALTPSERAALQNKWSRFQNFPEKTLRRLQTLHQNLQEHPDREDLQVVLVGYYHWLKELTPGLRDELIQLEPVARIARIEKEQTRQQVAPTDLPPADAQAVLVWLHEYFRQHREHFHRSLPEELRANRNSLGPVARRKAVVKYFLQTLPSRNVPEPTDEELKLLKQRLSSTSQRKLDQSIERGKIFQRIRDWGIQAVQSDRRPHHKGISRKIVRHEDLELFFENELSNELREELLGLPMKEMDRQLRQRYLHHRGGPHPPPGRPEKPPWLKRGPPDRRLPPP